MHLLIRRWPPHLARAGRARGRSRSRLLPSLGWLRSRWTGTGSGSVRGCSRRVARPIERAQGLNRGWSSISCDGNDTRLTVCSQPHWQELRARDLWHIQSRDIPHQGCALLSTFRPRRKRCTTPSSIDHLARQAAIASRPSSGNARPHASAPRGHTERREWLHLACQARRARCLPASTHILQRPAERWPKRCAQHSCGPSICCSQPARHGSVPRLLRPRVLGCILPTGLLQ